MGVSVGILAANSLYTNAGHSIETIAMERIALRSLEGTLWVTSTDTTYILTDLNKCYIVDQNCGLHPIKCNDAVNDEELDKNVENIDLKKILGKTLFEIEEPDKYRHCVEHTSLRNVICGNSGKTTCIDIVIRDSGKVRSELCVLPQERECEYFERIDLVPGKQYIIGTYSGLAECNGFDMYAKPRVIVLSRDLKILHVIKFDGVLIPGSAWYDENKDVLYVIGWDKAKQQSFCATYKIKEGYPP